MSFEQPRAMLFVKFVEHLARDHRNTGLIAQSIVRHRDAANPAARQSAEIDGHWFVRSPARPEPPQALEVPDLVADLVPALLLPALLFLALYRLCVRDENELHSVEHVALFEDLAEHRVFFVSRIHTLRTLLNGDGQKSLRLSEGAVDVRSSKFLNLAVRPEVRDDDVESRVFVWQTVGIDLVGQPDGRVGKKARYRRLEHAGRLQVRQQDSRERILLECCIRAVTVSGVHLQHLRHDVGHQLFVKSL